MSLADILAAQPTADEMKHVARAEHDGVRGTLETAPMAAPPTDEAALLEEHGYDPEAWAIDGGIGKHSASRWQQRARNKDTGEFETVWLSSYKFAVTRRANRLDIDELVTSLARWKPRTPPATTGDGVFVFQASDLQLGKTDGDGLDGTITRYLASIDHAVAEMKQQRKRHNITAAHLIFAGDCLEGNVSQGGKLMWRTSLTITEQVRVWRRLLLSTIKAFVPHVEHVHVSVVNGNHDQAQREPVQTRADDGWATEGAIAVADTIDALDLTDRVTVQVPERDRGYMTIGVNDTVFTIAHGHQWRAGKAKDWWSSQAFYQGNPAGAHFLCHGHWHATSITQDGPRTVVCSPTYDGGSAWYRDKTGAEARQGGLIYITHGPEFTNLSRI